MIAISSVLPARLGAFVLHVQVLAGADAGNVLTALLSLAGAVAAEFEPSGCELDGVEKRLSRSAN